MRSKMRMALRGFTLIELMIVIAIVGILIAVAYPMFSDAWDKAKKTEALIQLETIGKNAAMQFGPHGGYPATAAPLTPAVDCCTQNVGNKRKCAVVGTDWDTPEWNALSFTLSKEFYFQYSYTPSGSNQFTALAIGNMNCDPTVVTYTNFGDVVNNAPRMKITEPLYRD